MEYTKYLELEQKDNYFALPVLEQDIVTIFLNDKEVTSMVIPINGKLRCYLSYDKAPIQYKMMYQNGKPIVKQL